MSTIKKTLLTLTGIIFISIITIAVFAAVQPDFFVDLFNPELTTKIHRVSSFNQETASVDIEVGLKNKTFIPIRVNIANFLIKMNGKKLASSSKPFELRIKPFSRNQIYIPLELQISLLKETSQKFNPNKIDSAQYDVSLSYDMETLFGISDASTFTKSFKYPTIGLPKAEIDHVEVLKSNLNKQLIEVQIIIINPNPTDITVLSPRFSVQLDDREDFITGNLGDRLVLKKQTSTPRTLQIEIKNNKVLQLIGELIGHGKNLPIKLFFFGEIQNDSDLIKKSEIKLEVKGDMRSLIEASKKM